MKGSEELTLAALLLGFIGLVADLISIGVFVYPIITGNASEDITIPLITVRLLVLTLIFAVSIVLILFGANKNTTTYSFVFFVFGALYLIVSAAFLARISWIFMLENHYTAWEWLGYIILILLIFGFGAILYTISNIDTLYLVLPFLLVTGLQIGIWFWQFTFGELPLVIGVYIGNMLLFVVTSLLVIAMVILSD